MWISQCLKGQIIELFNSTFCESFFALSLIIGISSFRISSKTHTVFGVFQSMHQRVNNKYQAKNFAIKGNFHWTLTNILVAGVVDIGDK
jgi:hypothetical protein